MADSADGQGEVFAEYAAALYPPNAASDVAVALNSLMLGQQKLMAALGRGPATGTGR
jgi:hypothetical protein